MKDSDEYQRTERNHTGHALFTARRITDIHIFPPFIQTNSVRVQLRTISMERDEKPENTFQLMI